MEIRDKALDLAQFLENHMAASILILGDLTTDHIIKTIRQLVQELDFQKQANIDLLFKNTYSNRTIELLQQDQKKPLNDDEIMNLWHKAHGVKHGN